MSKHVFFVLDTSGSMAGKKMHQTKNAMKTILSDLREQDSMTIIEFDDVVKVWTDEGGNQFFSASQENKDNAMEYLDGLEADKGTNINDALIEALSIINQIKTKRKSETQYMVIFLTDGHVSDIQIYQKQIVYVICLEINNEILSFYMLKCSCFNYLRLPRE